MQDDVAPPFESWDDHLKALDNGQLADLAKDYYWLTKESNASAGGEGQAEFQNRRKSIIAECERRGMNDVAARCRQPS
jgi:hypothetical protein